MQEKVTQEEFKDIIHRRQRQMFGERYVGANLGTIDAPEWAQVKIFEFMKAKKHFLVWCGNKGIGKTHLGAALVEWSFKNFASFRKHRESDLQKKVRASMNEEKGDYLDFLKFEIDDDLLMIDDIGRDGWSPFREELLIETIDQRYNSMKPTIFTSNLSRADFEEKYHERIADRLFAKENFIIETMDLTSKRQ